MRSSPHKIVLALVLLLGVGCVNNLRRGDEMLAAGDLEGALIYYDNAVRDNPDSERARRKAAAVRGDLRDRSVARMDEALDRQNHEDAVVALRDVLAYATPEDGAQVVSRTCRALAAEVDLRLQAQRLADAYLLAESAQEVARSCLPNAFEHARVTWVRELRERSIESRSRGYLATAMLYALQVDVLETGAIREETVAWKKKLHDAAAVTVVGPTLESGDPAYKVARRMASNDHPFGVRVVAAGADAKFEGRRPIVWVTASVPKFTHDVRQQFREIEGAVPPGPTFGDGVPLGCRKKLVQVGPQTQYTCTVSERRHTKRVRMAATLELEGPYGSDKVEIEREVTDSDSEFTGPIGTDRDPLQLQSDETLENRIITELAAAAMERVVRMYEQYRTRMRRQANSRPHEDERIDALVRYVILEPERAEEDVVRHIRVTTGIPDVARLLARSRPAVAPD